MTLRQRYDSIIGYFRDNVPVAESELHFDSPFQLLVAVMLSAQCTDRRVNMVTPALFEAYPDPAALASASPEEVFGYIRSVTYPNSKAAHLVGMARKLVSDFGGEVPSEIDRLMSLPGVGRKTANVVASITWGERTRMCSGWRAAWVSLTGRTCARWSSSSRRTSRRSCARSPTTG